MNKEISLKNLLVSIIKSIDMYNFLLKDHHRRTAIIAYLIGNAYGLPKRNLDDLVLAASLHDIGALYVTERDKLIEIDIDNPSPHEIHGELMLKPFKPFEKIGKIIRHHHICFQDIENGTYSMDEIPIECFFLHLADRIDVLMLKNEGSPTMREIVIDNINKRFGTVFAPFLMKVFNQISESEDFWYNINVVSFHDLLFMAIDNEYFSMANNDIEGLAIVFARIVDYKSQWTMSHSYSVSKVAARIAELMGLSPDEQFEVKIAGYLHDIGKIAIPTELLDKNEPLTTDELGNIRSHVMYTSLILSPIKELENIIRLAANHHEKRDKSGYPLKLSAENFTIQMDILEFADIFSALSEDRPYRNSLHNGSIKSTLKEYIPNRLSKEVYDIIIENFDELIALLEDSKQEAIN